MAYNPNDDGGASAQQASAAVPGQQQTQQSSDQLYPGNPAASANAYRQGVDALYQKYYNRNATEAEQQAHAGNPNGLTGVEQMLAATPNQSQVPQQNSASSTPAPASTGSPVSADGKIPLQQAQSWTPPPAPAAVNLAPMNVPMDKLPTYQPSQFNVPTPAAYQPGQLAPAYTPDQLSQFNAPNQNGSNAQQSALMQAIMAHPETLSPDVVAQMKEAGKGDALLMQKQQQEQLDQSAAARGVVGSGQMDALRSALGQNTVNNILTGNRNIDIAAAQTNRQDQLNALNASEALAQGQLGRSVLGYNTGLAGQTAQAGLNQAGAASALQRSIAGESNQQQAAASRLANAGFTFGQQQANADQNYKGYQSQVAQSQDAVNRILAQFGINSAVAGNAQQNYGTQLGAGLSAAQLGENQRQFNNTLGFNYNQLDQQGQLGLLQYLLSSGAM